MNEILGFFSQGWVGSLIGLVGIALAVVMYVRSKKIARTAYQCASLQLIGKDESNLPDEVVVTYKGISVSRLAKTMMVLWNNGTEVVDRKDIVDSDPVLIIFTEEVRILSYSVIKRTRDVNGLSLSRFDGVGNILKVDFDYLDPGDGFLIEVLHDGGKRLPVITGAIKGFGEVFAFKGHLNINYLVGSRGFVDFVKSEEFYNYFMIFLGALFVVMGVLPDSFREFMNSHARWVTDHGWFYLLFGFIISAPSVLVVWLRRNRFPKSLDV